MSKVTRILQDNSIYDIIVVCDERDNDMDDGKKVKITNEITKSTLFLAKQR